MTSRQLRAVIKRYGDLGVLVVGCYLLAHSVWQRRGWVGTSLLILALGILLYLRHPKRQHNTFVPRIHAAIPVAPVSPGEDSVKTEPEEEISDYQPVRPLLQHARKVATLNRQFETYCWLDHQRLLLVYNDGGDYSGLVGWQGYAESLSLDTGQRRRLKGLTRLLNRISGTPRGFVPSPGGKWLTWDNFQTPDGWPFPVFAKMDGSHFQEGDQDKFSQTFWLNDHLWAEVEVRSFERPLYLNIHDVEHPRRENYYLQDSPRAKRLLRRYRERVPHAFEVMSPGPPDAFEIGEYVQAEHPGGEDKPLQTFRVHLPSSLQDVAVMASPQRKRVVYLFQCIVRLESATIPKEHETVSIDALWSSHVDGSDLHEIGYVCNKDAHLSEVQWLLDGKHLSFRYQEALYTVPVE